MFNSKFFFSGMMEFVLIEILGEPCDGDLMLILFENFLSGLDEVSFFREEFSSRALVAILESNSICIVFIGSFCKDLRRASFSFFRRCRSSFINSISSKSSWICLLCEAKEPVWRSKSVSIDSERSPFGVESILRVNKLFSVNSFILDIYS